MEREKNLKRLLNRFFSSLLLYVFFLLCVVLQLDLHDAGVHDHVNFCNIECLMEQLCAHRVMCVFLFLIGFLLLLLIFFFYYYYSRKNMFTFREFDNFYYIYCKCEQTAHKTKTRITLGNSLCLYSGKQRRRIKKHHPNTSSC